MSGGDVGFPWALARRYCRHLGSARAVLDLGCGRGDFGRYAPSSMMVHGIDRDERALEVAAQHEGAVTRVDLAREALPFGDAEFDGALAKDVLEHLPDPRAVLGELHRVLVPGAPLVVSVVVHYPRRVWDDPTHVRGFTRSAAAQLLADGGFKVEHTSRMGPLPGSSRLGFIDQVPRLLEIPLLGRLWTASWELFARRMP